MTRAGSLLKCLLSLWAKDFGRLTPDIEETLSPSRAHAPFLLIKIFLTYCRHQQRSGLDCNEILFLMFSVVQDEHPAASLFLSSTFPPFSPPRDILAMTNCQLWMHYFPVCGQCLAIINSAFRNIRGMSGAVASVYVRASRFENIRNFF